MNVEDIKRVCVVGAGNKGHQIALRCALSGYTVKCIDIDPEALKKAEDFASCHLNARVKKGKMTEDQARNVRGKLFFLEHLEEACRDADYVIEAVPEELSLKRAVFAELDRVAPPRAILATKSFTIFSSALADATRRPEKVLNVHFFNPALITKLVEVVQGPHVSDETLRVTVQFCETIGKVPVHVKKEAWGLILNRIYAAISREALWMLEMGVASLEDIDKACVFGAGHPIGPFRLNDLTGLDFSYDLAMDRFRETGDSSFLPAPSLTERVAKGHLGQKTGKGWYDYSGSTPTES